MTGEQIKAAFQDGMRSGDLELRLLKDAWEIVRWTAPDSCHVVAFIDDRSDSDEQSDLRTVGLRPWKYDGPVDFWVFARRCIEFISERSDWMKG